MKLNIYNKEDKPQENQIAFVGTINSGKSTLINALLGKNLAAVSVTPETAVLSKFKSTKSRNYIKLKFYSKLEWNKLWESVEKSNSNLFKEEYFRINGGSKEGECLGADDKLLEFEDEERLIAELQKWTSSKMANHYFVKEIEIGVQNLEIPEDIVIVDTPGFDDPVEYRSNISKNYIAKADFLMLCVKVSALTAQELALIEDIFSINYNRQRVYVIATQLDSLNNPKRDWEKQREEWIKHLSRADFFGSFALARRKLIVVSAYLYNLLQKHNDLDAETIYFDLEALARKFRIKDAIQNRRKLIDLSNVDNLKFKIEEEIIDKLELFGRISLNYANLEELVKLAGIGESYAKEIMNYRKKNNGFDNISQLKEIKGIGQKKYEQLKDKVKVRTEKIGINSADLDELMRINGIGKIYSKRIINYRQKRGRFKDKSELLNVKGIGQQRFKCLFEQFEL